MENTIHKTPGGNYVKLMSTTEMSKIGVMSVDGDIYSVVLSKDTSKITMTSVKDGRKVSVIKNSKLYRFLCTLLDSVGVSTIAIRVRE